ncbi:F-box/LRR-repeat protein [Rosa sericea]
MSTDGVISEKENKRRRRRWEELDMDCLSKVFNRVGMESLILAVPFVCESWYKASLSPLSWQELSFPELTRCPWSFDDDEARSFGTFYDKFMDHFGINRSSFSITGFVKSVVDRSKGGATLLWLPAFCTEEALRYVSDACPLLKFLGFVDDLVLFKHSQVLPEVIGKWKYLEVLHLGGSSVPVIEQMMMELRKGKRLSERFKAMFASESPDRYNVLERIVVQIGAHCKRFTTLSLYQVDLGEVEALAIVNLLPNLRCISATGCTIERDTVVTIMRGCKNLGLFRANHCGGFEDNDGEISKLASKTRHFACEGCSDLPARATAWRKYVFFRIGWDIEG